MLRCLKKNILGSGILLGCALLGLSGCEEEKQTVTLHAQVAPKVELAFPDRPDFSSVIESSVSQDEGILTTWEAVFKQKKYLNKEIRVKGVIQTVSEDCPAVTLPKKAKKRGQPEEEVDTHSYKCRNLFVTIQSPEGCNKTILVTGYHPYYHPYLKPGMTVDVTGDYVLYTSTGFVEPVTGLISTKEFHGMAVSKKGKFTTDRHEISEMIAKRDVAGMKFRK